MIGELVQRETTMAWPGYGSWEYLLIVPPGKNVYQKVSEHKETFSETYKYHMAAATKPHITVANFLAKEAMEETLIRWMQNIFKTHKSFPVTLSNFNGFAPHTIYVSIENVAPFRALAASLQALDGFIQACDCPPLYTVMHPHLTLACKLPLTLSTKPCSTMPPKRLPLRLLCTNCCC
jgi:2'-5' RNA ligase